MIRAPRRYVPASVKRRIHHSRLYVRHRSTAQQVYFACVQKTASRWLRRLLRDERVFRASGLDYLDYIGTLPTSELRSLTETRFRNGFPLNTIVGPLYTAYDGYVSIPKPKEYRAFFVLRDPRDIVVSWYYSMRYSHASMDGRFDEVREDLESRSERDGLKRAIDLLEGSAQLFPALRSWVGAQSRDDRVLLVRYEDLTGPKSAEAFRQLFTHCDIRLDDHALIGLLADYSFEKMAGRPKGQEDVASHYRKGEAGAWREHFDGDLIQHFTMTAGDLLEAFGYE